MNMKKITAIAAAVVMAAGICTGVPKDTENIPALSITAEAANSDFVIKTDDDGDKYVAGYKGKGGDVVIPDGIVWIDEKAFFGNDKITSVTIPKSCYNFISSYAFSQCINLKKVVIEGDIGIGKGAFECCINLESVTVKGSVHDGIFASAFYRCERLKTVKINGNESDFAIGTSAFEDCFSLTSVNIPSRCTEIYNHAFLNCFNLTKLTIPAKTKINTTSNDGAYQFGYAIVAGEAGQFIFVADGKKFGYVSKLYSKEDAVKKGISYKAIGGSDILVQGPFDQIPPQSNSPSR